MVLDFDSFVENLKRHNMSGLANSSANAYSRSAIVLLIMWLVNVVYQRGEATPAIHRKVPETCSKISYVSRWSSALIS